MNLLSVIWLYNRTGSAYLLDLARLLHQQGYDWMAQYAISSTPRRSPRSSSSSTKATASKISRSPRTA